MGVDGLSRAIDQSIIEPNEDALFFVCFRVVTRASFVLTIGVAFLGERFLANKNQVYRQQYKDRGHVIHYLRDVDKVYSELPLLPKNLDIVIFRPRGSKGVEQAKEPFGT